MSQDKKIIGGQILQFDNKKYWQKRMIQKVSETLTDVRKALDQEVGQNAIHIDFKGMDKDKFLAARQKIYGGFTDLILAIVPEAAEGMQKPAPVKDIKKIEKK